MASALVTGLSQTHHGYQPVSCWVHRSQLTKENGQPSKVAVKELTGARDLQANIRKALANAKPTRLKHLPMVTAEAC